LEAEVAEPGALYYSRLIGSYQLYAAVGYRPELNTTDPSI
jgi:hypothetical protein